MKIEYYPDTDTLYIDIKETLSASSQEISNGVLLDYDENGNLTGIEIDNAKKVVDITKLETKSLPMKDLMFS
jgi:uncharacterized protein YuzE